MTNYEQFRIELRKVKVRNDFLATIFALVVGSLYVETGHGEEFRFGCVHHGTW